MHVCVKCNKAMVTERIGLHMREYDNCFRSGDLYKCEECGYELLTNFGQRFYPKEEFLALIWEKVVVDLGE